MTARHRRQQRERDTADAPDLYARPVPARDTAEPEIEEAVRRLEEGWPKRLQSTCR